MTRRIACRRAAALLFVTLFIPGAASAQRPGSSIATDRILDAIGAKEGVTICEIGAGDGDLSIAAARIVGPTGRVYTNELGESRVKSLQERVAGSGLPQITVVAADPARTNFPDAACDALFMRNVYHHFGDPAAMNASIVAALKPGGRVAVVDFSPPREEATRATERDDDGTHGVTPGSVARELKAAGLEPVSDDRGEQRWFMVVVAKPTR